MTLFEREIREQPEILRQLTRSDAPQAAARALADRDPRFVVTLARGSSANAASFFSYLVALYLNLPGGPMPPSIASVHERSPRATGGLAVGVSQSGRSEDVLRALSAFSRGGATTLAVSNNPTSPLAQAADWHLPQGAGEEKAVAATKTFSSQMMALALLVAHWSGSPELLASLGAVPNAAEVVLRGVSGLERAALRLTHASELWVLGRGLNAVAATETALKLKETSYIQTQAYSSAEVLHGPQAAISVNTPVLMFGLGDATAESNLVTARRLRELGADLTVISSQAALLDLANNPVPLAADLPPVTETFVQIIAGQLLTLQLVQERGLDPDQPRNLSKVTHTI